MDDVRIASERLSAGEYIDFLRRTDLGSQYPKERFEERIEKLVTHAAVSLTARCGKELIGVLFAVTDFAYWMFVTDLGVDRRCVRRGVGTRLMDEALRLAGGGENIIVYTCANENAVSFYEKWGMTRAPGDVMVRNQVEWTPFEVQ